jgi:hypothetical protein
MRRPYITAAILGLLAVPAGAVFAPSVMAAEPATFELVLKDHRFTPDRLEVPAGEKIALVVKNQDPTPEEFDSHDLKREKVVKGGQEIRVLVGPLAAGEYKFAGEYNEKTAKGVLVAK